MDKKGVVVSQIGKKIDGNIKNSGDYHAFHDYLIAQSLPENHIHRIELAKTLHDTRWFDVNDVRYQEIVIVIRKIISTYSEASQEKLDINGLKKKCMQELQARNLLSESLDETLVEVLYYEHKFNQNS